MPARIVEEVEGPLGMTHGQGHDHVPEHSLRFACPSCGSSHIAQVLGDNGGISYVCTACGHSWS